MVLKARCLLPLVPLVLGGFLSSSTTMAHESVGSHEEGIHAQGHAGSHSEGSQPEEVKIVMREGAYHVLQGGHSDSNSVWLVAGEDARLSIRNEDTIAHEVISPLFMRADIHLEGKGIGIFRKEAAGFRLRPGDAVTIQFTVPFLDFASFYDLIWCSRHEDHVMNGKEVLVVKTQSKQSQP